jgi:asparagine synthase (glutamine-hydrolysing)
LVRDGVDYETDRRVIQRLQESRVSLLRDVAARHVRLDTLPPRKQGCFAPDASWFRGESIDYVRRTLMGKDARLFSYLDRTAVQELIRQHLDGEKNRRLLIWSLLTLEQWLATFAVGRGIPEAGGLS